MRDIKLDSLKEVSMDISKLAGAFMTHHDILDEFRPDWTEERAKAWLECNRKKLGDLMYQAGLDAMERLLDKQYPRGEFCECCEDFFDASDMVGDTCKDCMKSAGQTKDELQ